MPNDHKPIILYKPTSLDLRELRLQHGSTTVFWSLSGVLLAACSGGGNLSALDGAYENFEGYFLSRPDEDGTFVPTGTPVTRWVGGRGIEQSEADPDNADHVVYDFGYRVHLGDHNGDTDSQKAVDLFGFSDGGGNRGAEAPSSAFYGIFINPAPSLAPPAGVVRLFYSGAVLAAHQEHADDASDYTDIAMNEALTGYFYVSLENLANLVVVSDSNAEGTYGFDYRVWDGETISRAGSRVTIDIERVDDLGVFHAADISTGSMMETDHDGNDQPLDTGITFRFTDDERVDISRFSVSDSRFAVADDDNTDDDIYKVVLRAGQVLNLETSPTPTASLTLNLSYMDEMGRMVTMTDTGVAASATLTVTNLAEAPVEVRNLGEARVNVGGTRNLTAQHLLYEDPEQAATAITYTLTDISQLTAQGVTIMNGSSPLAVDDTFTQANLNAGNISIVQNDTTHPTPSGNVTFSFTVDDGDSNSPAGDTQTFTISFNSRADDAPLLFDNAQTAITVSENARGPENSSFTFGDGNDLKSDLIVELTIGSNPATIIHQGTTTFTTEFMYGMLEVTRNSGTASSSLRYTVNTDNATVNALTASGMLSDTSFSITVKDPDTFANNSSATSNYTITITGFDDEITFGVEGAHSNTGEVTEDGTTVLGNTTIGWTDPDTALGDITITATEDAREDRTAASAPVEITSTSGQQTITTDYGQFIFLQLTAGTLTWTYTLNNANADVQALKAGEERTDVIRLDTPSGQSITSIVVTINGASEAADFAEASVTPTMTEDDDTIEGMFTFSDTDNALWDLIIIETRGDTLEKNDSHPIQDGTRMTLNHGTFIFSRDDNTGVLSWTYDLDNDSDAVDHLVDNGSLMETITLAVRDPHGDEADDTVSVTITITGIDDPVSFRSPPEGGDRFGEIVMGEVFLVREDDPNLNSVEGVLQIVDTDTDLSTIMLRAEATSNNAIIANILTQGGFDTRYGNFTLFERDDDQDDLGQLRWRYVLDNSRDEVQDLEDDGMDTPDIITLSVGDIRTTITINIEGAVDDGDAPRIESRSDLEIIRYEDSGRGSAYTLYFSDPDTMAADLTMQVGIDSNRDGTIADDEFSAIALNTEVDTSLVTSGRPELMAPVPTAADMPIESYTTVPAVAPQSYAKILFSDRTSSGMDGSIQWFYILDPMLDDAISADGTTEEEIKIRITNGNMVTTERTLTIDLRGEDKAPVLVHNNQIKIERFTTSDVVLSSAYLYTSDEDTPADQIVYTLGSRPGRGVDLYRILDATTGDSQYIGGGTFTQQEINDGVIVLRHNGYSTSTSLTQFRFNVTDGTTTLAPNAPPPNHLYVFSIDILPNANRPPVEQWNFNNINVVRGERVAITQSSLSYEDPEQDAAALTYTIIANSLLNGKVVYDPTPATVGTDQADRTTFTQAEINAGQIFFVHDDVTTSGTTRGGFNFTVSDGAGAVVGGTGGIRYRLNVASNEFPTFRPMTIGDNVVVTIPDSENRITLHELTLTVTESNTDATTATTDQVFIFSDLETTTNSGFAFDTNLRSIAHNADANGTDIVRNYGTFTITRNDTNGTITVRYTLDNTNQALENHHLGATPLEDSIFMSLVDTGGARARANVKVLINGVDEPGTPPSVRTNNGIVVLEATDHTEGSFLASNVLQYVDTHQTPEQIVYTLGDISVLTASGIEVARVNEIDGVLGEGATFTQAEVNQGRLIIIRQNDRVEPMANSVVLPFTVWDNDPTTTPVVGTLNIAITRVADPATTGLPPNGNVQRLVDVPDPTPNAGFTSIAEGVMYFGDPDTPIANLHLTLEVNGNPVITPLPTNAIPDPDDAYQVMIQAAYGTFHFDRDNTGGTPDPTTNQPRGVIRYRYELNTAANGAVDNLISGEELIDNLTVKVRDDAAKVNPDVTEQIHFLIYGQSEIELPENPDSTNAVVIPGLVFSGRGIARDPDSFTLYKDHARQTEETRFEVVQGTDDTTYQIRLKAGESLNYEDPDNSGTIDAATRALNGFIPIVIGRANYQYPNYAVLTLTDVPEAPGPNSATGTLTLVETDGNDEGGGGGPVVLGVRTPLAQAETEHSDVTITNTYLNHVDEDAGDGPARVRYTLTDITGLSANGRGIEILNGTTVLAATDTFTQANINSGDIKLRQLKGVEPAEAVVDGDVNFMYTVDNGDGTLARTEQTFTFTFDVVDDKAEFQRAGFYETQTATEGTVGVSRGSATIHFNDMDVGDALTTPVIVYTGAHHDSLENINSDMAMMDDDDTIITTGWQDIALTHGTLSVRRATREIDWGFVVGERPDGTSVTEKITFAIRDPDSPDSVDEDGNPIFQDFRTIYVTVIGVQDDLVFTTTGNTNRGAVTEGTSTTPATTISATTIGMTDPDTDISGITIVATEDARVSPSSGMPSMANITSTGGSIETDYGRFTFAAFNFPDTQNMNNGNLIWSYELLDNDLVNGLTTGDDPVDTITLTYTQTVSTYVPVTRSFNTATEDITETISVTITGADDPLVFGATTRSGSVTEGTSTTAATTIGNTTLSFTDPDTALADITITATEDMRAVGTASAPVDIASTGGAKTLTTDYGTFTFQQLTAETLTWSYALLDNAKVNELNTDDTPPTDIVTLTGAGATPTTITVTINGADDLPMMTAVTSPAADVAVDDDPAEADTTAGGSFTFTDPDTAAGDITFALATYTDSNGMDATNAAVTFGTAIELEYGSVTLTRSLATMPSEANTISWEYTINTTRANSIGNDMMETEQFVLRAISSATVFDDETIDITVTGSDVV